MKGIHICLELKPGILVTSFHGSINSEETGKKIWPPIARGRYDYYERSI